MTLASDTRARLPAGPAYRPRALDAARLLCGAALRAALAVSVEGARHIPPDGPVIVAGNHTGFLDGPLVVLLAPRRSRALVKAELYTGLLGWLLRLGGQLPVRRGRPDRRALHGALEVLARGELLTVFPEGTRGGGRLEQVQHGVAWLALRAACPIVPVACFGTAEALPKGARTLRWRTPVRIVFGPAFTVTPHGDVRSRAVVAGAAEQIQAQLARHLATAEAGDE